MNSDNEYFDRISRNGYDLAVCLEYNPQDGFSVDDIDRVLAVWEGENDGDSWRWILALNNGKFVFMDGWCDYTGWDCQSGAMSVITDTVEEALAATSELAGMYEPGNPGGLGRMIDILSGNFADNVSDVTAELARQVTEGRKQTSREAFDAEWRTELT